MQTKAAAGPLSSSRGPPRSRAEKGRRGLAGRKVSVGRQQGAEVKKTCGRLMTTNRQTAATAWWRTGQRQRTEVFLWRTKGQQTQDRKETHAHTHWMRRQKTCSYGMRAVWTLKQKKLTVAAAVDWWLLLIVSCTVCRVRAVCAEQDKGGNCFKLAIFRTSHGYYFLSKSHKEFILLPIVFKAIVFPYSLPYHNVKIPPPNKLKHIRLQFSHSALDIISLISQEICVRLSNFVPCL